MANFAIPGPATQRVTLQGHVKAVLLCLLAIATLAGCSSGVVDKLSATTQAALSGPKDTTLSAAQLKSLQYSAQYVRLQGAAQNVLILAYTNTHRPNNKHSANDYPQQFQQWQSKAGESLLFSSGRLVGTRGIAKPFSPYKADLMSVNRTGQQSDPLHCALTNSQNPATCNGQWQAKILWGQGQAQQTFNLTSNVTYQGQQQVQLGNGNTINAAYFTEQAQVISDSGRQDEYTNHYWYARQQLVKTAQQLVPGLPKLTTLSINLQQQPLSRAEGSHSSTLAALEQQLDVSANDNQLTWANTTYALSGNARLSQVIANLIDSPQHINWSQARLNSEHLQLRVDTLKDDLLLDLAQQHEIAIATNDTGLATASRWLYQYINNTQFNASYYLGIPYYQLRTDPSIDPVLAEPQTAHNGSWFNPGGNSDFILQLQATNNVADNSRIPSISMNNYATRLSKALEQRFASAAGAFNTDSLYRISANGDISQIPVAAYNQRQPASCWQHQVSAPTQALLAPKQDTARDCWPHRWLQADDKIVVGLTGHDQLNRRIALLAKFAQHFDPLAALTQSQEAVNVQ